MKVPWRIPPPPIITIALGVALVVARPPDIIVPRDDEDEDEEKAWMQVVRHNFPAVNIMSRPSAPTFCMPICPIARTGSVLTDCCLI